MIVQHCFCRLLSLSRASQLGPHIKFRTWHMRTPKNLSPSHQEPAVEDVWGGPAVLLAQDKPVRRPREFSLREPNEHESNWPCKARRPTRGERLRFLEPERRRTGPTGAGREWEPARNVPRPPPFRRRSSLSDGSSQSGRIQPGVVEARGCVEISLPAWCPGCSRVVEPNNLAFGDASHCCTARLKRLQLERLRALVKQL